MGNKTQLQQMVSAEPDLVDRIFDYIFSDPVLAQAIASNPEIDGANGKRTAQLKAAVRAEFKGEECYIAGRPATARQEQVVQILALFNGRNASEVARRLNIGRATVYRVVRQSEDRKKLSQFSGK